MTEGQLLLPEGWTIRPREEVPDEVVDAGDAVEDWLPPLGEFPPPPEKPDDEPDYAYIYGVRCIVEKVPIDYVTNGVHFPTWVAPEALDLYNEAFGEDFIHNQSDMKRWERIRKVDDKKLWELRNSLRRKAIQRVKNRLKRAIVKKLEDPRFIMEVEENLCDDVLTIGFARRFATYKRAHLLFRDLERLSRIINHPDRPVQFLFAGKPIPMIKRDRISSR